MYIMNKKSLSIILTLLILLLLSVSCSNNSPTNPYDNLNIIAYGTGIDNTKYHGKTYEGTFVVRENGKVTDRLKRKIKIKEDGSMIMFEEQEAADSPILLKQMIHKVSNNKYVSFPPNTTMVKKIYEFKGDKLKVSEYLKAEGNYYTVEAILTLIK